MNRRNFFSVIAGAIGGVVAVFVPKANSVVWIAPKDGVKKRSGVKFIAESNCGCGEQRLIPCNGRIIVVCPNHHPYYINSDGTKEYLRIEHNTSVCYCHKPGDTVACNYPKCKDYSPGNEKPYKDEYE